MIVKNFMCELDEDCDKNNKKDYLSFSFLCFDDDRVFKSICMDFDLFFFGFFIMESLLER